MEKSKSQKMKEYVSSCTENEHICLDCMFKKLGVISTQYSGDTRIIRNMGFLLERDQNGNFNRPEYCPVCDKKTSHIVYLGKADVVNNRVPFSSKEKKRILKLLGSIDAFTGQTTTNPTIDHKVPYTVYNNMKKTKDMSDDEIKDTFQVLSNYHNTEKDRACAVCKLYGRRPPFLAMGPYYYEGDSKYTGTCAGCGWCNASAWKKAQRNGTLIRDEQVMSLAKISKKGDDILETLNGFKELIEEFPDELKLKNIIQPEEEYEKEISLW